MESTMNNGNLPYDSSRRDFIFIAAASFAGIGGAMSLWPVIDSLNPAADVRAEATVEIDLSPIELGQRVTVLWQGKPIFIDHRTPEQIARARADDNNPDLIDPATDAERVQRAEWLIVIGICTHLGCIPQGQRTGSKKGNWGGWYCSCHGSQYDLAGRVRIGPAPRNLDLPPYKFLSDTLVRIG